MIVLSMEAITQWVASLLWPLFRISAFFMTVPLLGSQLVPTRIRLYLSLGFTVMLWPMIDVQLWPSVDLAQAIFISLQQLLIGLAMGLLVQVLFQIPALAGQIISMQNGLGFAMMVDPVNGINVASIGQLYLLMANLLFLAMNGHVVILQVLAASFETLPIGHAGGLSLHDIYQLIGQGSWLFSSALLIALPAITALLLVNLAFGLMARLAPQLNIFAIGFPFSMVFGLLVLWVTLSGFLPQFSQLTEQCLLLLRDMVR
jgi:flagellar biosynthetic protein FliR